MNAATGSNSGGCSFCSVRAETDGLSCERSDAEITDTGVLFGLVQSGRWRRSGARIETAFAGRQGADAAEVRASTEPWKYRRRAGDTFRRCVVSRRKRYAAPLPAASQQGAA